PRRSKTCQAARAVSGLGVCPLDSSAPQYAFSPRGVSAAYGSKGEGFGYRIKSKLFADFLVISGVIGSPRSAARAFWPVSSGHRVTVSAIPLRELTRMRERW